MTLLKRSLLVVVFTFAFAAPADAAVYSGAADDGTKVTIKTNAAGKPTLVTFGDYESDCTNHWTNSNPLTGFKAPFDEGTADRIVERGKVKGTRHVDNVDGPVDLKASWNFKADLTDGDEWRGKFKTTGVFSQDGERLSKCTAGFAFAVGPR